MKYFSKLAVEPTFFYYRIRVSKALAAQCARQLAQKMFVQLTFVRWR